MRSVHLRALGIALIYYGLIHVSLLAIVSPENVSVIWVPSGFLTAVLILTPRREWAWTFVWVGAVHIVADLSAGRSLVLVAGYTLANGLEILVATLLYQRTTRGLKPFMSVRSVVALPLLGIGSLLSATIAAGAGVLDNGGVGYITIWASWFLSSFDSMLVVTPTILVLCTDLKIRWTRWTYTEAVFLLVLLVVAVAAAFGTGSDSSFFLYLPFPLIMWAALRFDVHGAVIASVVLAAVAIAFTVAGEGTMLILDNPSRLLWLQAYLGGAMLTGLVVAAAIREREAAEQARHLLASATEQSEDGIAVLSKDWRVIYYNKSYANIVGKEEEGAVSGSDPRTLLGSSTLPWDEIVKTLEQGELWQNTVAFGESVPRKYETIRVAPIREATTSISHYVLLRRDVTKEFQMASALSQAQKMEAIGVLAGGIAHDFNNLLTAILGRLDLAERSTSPAASIQQAREAALEAASLTRQLLTLGRRADLRPSACDINATVAKALRLFHKSDAVTTGLQLDADLPTIYLDSEQFTQTLLNLLINAQDAMPEGGNIRITTSLRIPSEAELSQHPNAARGSYMELVVSDTGHGMNAETMASIFEPFFTTKTLEKGTGLGLAMVYSFAQAHRGWIDVQSEEGKGTSFSMLIPEVHHTVPAQSEADDQAPVSILLVDDTELVLESLQQALMEDGYAVQVAKSGNAALLLFDKYGETLDVVVTDLSMRNGDGRALLQGLRDRGATLPVILMSGLLDSESSATEGFAGYVPKPFSPALLATAIKKALTPRT